MNTIFMEILEIAEPHRILLNLKDKIDLRRKVNYIALSNLCIYIEKYKKVI